MNAKVQIDQLRRTGFFSIVFSGILNRIIQFISGVILVRVLSTSEYGAYSYALNIVNYFVLLNGLGLSSSIVQFCVEQNSEESAERMYRTASSLAMLWDLFLTVAIVVVALWVPLPIEGSNSLLLLLSPFPLFSLMVELQQQRLRSMFRATQYAIATNLNTILIVAFSIFGALVGLSEGLSFGRTLSMLISAAVIVLAFKIKVYVFKVEEPHKVVLDMLKLSLTVCSAAAASQMLILCGTTLIGAFLGDDKAVAVYTSASTIPFALTFLPQMIVTYASPYFVRHAHEREWILHYWKRCSLGAFLLCLSIGAVLILIADWLIPFVFGPQYSDATLPFIILLIGFMFGQPFRVVSMSVLGSHRKNVTNLVVSIIMLVINFVICQLLMNHMGIAAAALGYTISIICGGALSSGAAFHYAGQPNEAVSEIE